MCFQEQGTGYAGGILARIYLTITQHFFAKNGNMSNEIAFLCKNLLNEDEFEISWKAIMKKYNAEENKHFQSLWNSAISGRQHISKTASTHSIRRRQEVKAQTRCGKNM